MAWAGLVLGAASTLLSGGGQVATADSERAASIQESMQLEQIAGQERAAGQHNAARMREEAKRLMSRQRSQLAKSGFDATDRTSETIVSDTAAITSLEALLTEAQAEERGRFTDYGAKMRLKGGKMAQRAGYAAAGGTVLSGLYDVSRNINWGGSNTARSG